MNISRRAFLKLSLLISSLFYLPIKNYAEERSKRVLLLETVIAGFQYYEGEKIWNYLKKGEILKLKREQTNPYDEKTIEIYWKNKKLGYIPRVDNSVIAQLMDRKNELIAYITWLKTSENPWERIGINVELII